MGTQTPRVDNPSSLGNPIKHTGHRTFPQAFEGESGKAAWLQATVLLPLVSRSSFVELTGSASLIPNVADGRDFTCHDRFMGAHWNYPISPTSLMNIFLSRHRPISLCHHFGYL